MSNGSNDIKTYSAEDLARYWEGKMSPQEMHALEAAAMDDPFLADALEGYAAVTPASAATDAHELRERLLERSKDDKIVPTGRKNNWWRVAAILIFLGGASVLTYLLMQQNGNTNVVAKQEAAASNSASSSIAPPLNRDTLTAQKNTDSINAKNNVAIHFKTYTPDPGINQKGNASSPVMSADQVTVPDLSAYKSKDTGRMIAAADKQYQADSLANTEAKRLSEQLQGRAAGVQNNQANARRDNNDQAYNINNFSGRVVDQRNNAVPYASVRMNNSNQVTSTNNDGYFQIKSPDTLLNLSINSAGYETRNVTLRGNEPQNVTLEQDGKKLKEVVVTASSARKRSMKAETKLSVYVMDAQPVIGWDEYNKYLDSSKHAADNANPPGEVVISFSVNKRGQLSDFTIEQSLNKARDNEAIRLVKEGPEWKLLKGKKTRARVIITF